MICISSIWRIASNMRNVYQTEIMLDHMAPWITCQTILESDNLSSSTQSVLGTDAQLCDKNKTPFKMVRRHQQQIL